MRWTTAAALIVIGTALVAHGTTVVDVKTAPVTVGSVSHDVIATGTLQAVATVDITTPLSGVIQSLDADDDTVVHAGDIVARLDPSMYDAALREARAALAQARSDVQHREVAEAAARSTLLRDEQLAASKLIAAVDLDAANAAANTAVAERRSAESAAAAAEAAVKTAEANLEHTIIRSPVDGIVLLRNADVGQTLAASLQAPVLYRLASDLHELQLRIELDVPDAGDVMAGESVAFSVESFGTTLFHGEVTQALSTSSRVAIVDVRNADERLRPGMTATVVLSGPHRDGAIRVPIDALTFRPPPEAAAILDGDGLTLDGESSASATDHRSLGEGGQATDLREVWLYDRGRLTPVGTKIGVVGQGWAEVVGGPLQPGDEVATGVITRRTSLASRLATWIP